MNARSALFDVYGDHILPRGGVAPVAALVRLLAPLEVAAPAVRTAISRMVSQAWLSPVRTPLGPGYALTPHAAHWLDEVAARVYRTHQADWDGRWHLLVIGRVKDRSGRDRLRAGLRFLGYAPLDEGTWIAARPSPELEALLATEKLGAERFCAVYEADTAALVRRLWDLDVLAEEYRRWLGEAAVIVAGAGDQPSDEAAFAVRSRLVHEWRKFLFRDPALPRELLPAEWPGDQAAEYFDAESARLLSSATRFIDRCLALAD